MVSLDGFRAPALDVPTFYDVDGAPIDYGNRWQDSPPEESYSRVSNLSRFAPLRTHATALMEYLESVALVTVTINSSRNETRFLPAAPAAAPLAFTFREDLSMVLRAGLLTEFLLPVCSCDACDSTAEVEIDNLNAAVSGVISGRFQETFTPRGHGFEILGHSSSWTRTARHERRVVRRARRETVRRGPWEAWSPR